MNRQSELTKGRLMTDVGLLRMGKYELADESKILSENENGHLLRNSNVCTKLIIDGSD